MAKLMSGILPPKIETGRCNGVHLEERTCRFCGLDVEENEYPFLFDCAPLQGIRGKVYVKHIGEFIIMTDSEKVQVFKYIQVSVWSSCTDAGGKFCIQHIEG